MRASELPMAGTNTTSSSQKVSVFVSVSSSSRSLAPRVLRKGAPLHDEVGQSGEYISGREVKTTG